MPRLNRTPAQMNVIGCYTLLVPVRVRVDQKQTFAELAQGCTCPKSFPICVCGNKPKVKVITKGALIADDTEQTENPRARSAKLRVAEKL